MSNGIERRSQIDTETVRALLLINGGGAVALLTLLPALLANSDLRPLVSAIFIGVLLLMVGLVSAVIHSRFRRECSLIYDQHDMRPPHGHLFGMKLSKPRVCFISDFYMWLSIFAFFGAGSFVAVVGIRSIN
jgi:hypothetical protein